MCPAQPSEQFVRAVLDEAGLKLASEVQRVRNVNSSGLHRVYELVFSNGRTLELVMPPTPMLRLLRLERRIINSEAVVVQWLTKILSANNERVVDDPGSTQENGVDDGFDEGSDTDDDGEDEQDEERTTQIVDGSLLTNHGEGPRRRSSGTESQQDADRSSLWEGDPGLLHLLPRLVHQSSSSTAEPNASSYALYQQRDRITISKLPTALTDHQRAEVDYQLGVTTRRFSTFTSPTGHFGPVACILASTDHRESPQPRNNGSRSPSATTSIATTAGSRTWYDTFHLMLEDILRDAEDMAIQVPYPTIRKHLARFSWALDEIIEPQLVFIDGADDSNVLVAVDRDGLNQQERREEEDEDEDEDEEEPEEDSDSDGSSSSKNENSNQQQAPEHIDHLQKGPTSRYKLRKPVTICGLNDASNAIFGDPLIASVFNTYPSNDFLQGYHNTHIPESILPTPPYKNNDDVSPAEIRLLLYQLYHATVSVVKEFYRPKSNSSMCELAARRRLTAVLQKLSEIEDGPRRDRHRRPSGEMSPAKKLKADENSSRKWEAASPLREWIDGDGGS